ncbi:MAG TPA: sigma-70 family RNA polymerase sigma factor [Planctomycetota bacterium]|jgi:RNA polymerase sigma-70 factor (ECF subfamily)
MRDEAFAEMTDRQLLEAYAGSNDFKAFAAFVDRHESSLLSFASAFLRDDTLAQDVVQEAFLRAARYPQRLLVGSASLSAGTEAGATRNWMLKVVRDLSIDNLRRKANEKRAVQERAAISAHAAPAADAIAEGAEEASRVRAAIERLNPRLRELLILKVREHKSYKEIAQITGLSATNVGFLLHRAMQELGKELQGSGFGVQGAGRRSEPRP